MIASLLAVAAEDDDDPRINRIRVRISLAVVRGSLFSLSRHRTHVKRTRFLRSHSLLVLGFLETT